MPLAHFTRARHRPVVHVEIRKTRDEPDGVGVTVCGEFLHIGHTVAVVIPRSIPVQRAEVGQLPRVGHPVMVSISDDWIMKTSVRRVRVCVVVRRRIRG